VRNPGPSVGRALSFMRGLGAIGVISEILLDVRPVAISEVYTSIQRLRNTKQNSDQQGCVSGYVRRSNAYWTMSYGNEYAEFLSGSRFDYGVIDRYGNSILYDGLVQGTLNFVVEAKRNYHSTFFVKDHPIPNTPNPTARFTLNKFDEQRSKGQTVADNCGLVYSWHFSNQDVADVVEEAWRSKSTPVYWTSYPG
jgi:hypothetical protein